MEYYRLRDVHRRRRNKVAAPVGAVVLVLAAAGLVALILLGVNLTQQIYDNSREKGKFEKIVQPVLMFDPPVFSDATTLPVSTLLESALWATMLGDKRETYTYDAQGSLIVPTSDVDVTAASLFGSKVKLEHKSFPSDFGLSYEYEEARKAYHVPVLSATALYTPRVDEIERAGDVYSLLVGYIPPGTAWNSDIAGKKTEPDPHKFMIYKLQKLDKHYQLIAIEDPPPEKQVQLGSSAAESSGAIAVVPEENSAADILGEDASSLPEEGDVPPEGEPEEGDAPDGSSEATAE